MASIAEWLKGISPNTKQTKYRAPTGLAVDSGYSKQSDAAKQAAADAQINSKYSSNLSGSASTRSNNSSGLGAGIGGYNISAARNESNKAAAAAQAAADAQANSTYVSSSKDDTVTTTSTSGSSNKSSIPSSSNSNRTSTSYNESNNSSSSSNTTTSGGSGGSGGSASSPANKAQLILGLPVEAQRAALSDIQSLADLYGIDYNRDNIESVFKDATNAAHEANLKEYNRTARQYYDKLGATQNSLIDTLRKQRAASITSGANAGMQNATELSEILGLTQTVSPDALALAQDRNALIEAYNAQLTQDVRDAMEYSDQLKQALAALASEKYGYDAQQYVAELSHNANVQAQNTASSAAYTGNKYATLEDILGLAVVPSLTYTKKE